MSHYLVGLAGKSGPQLTREKGLDISIIDGSKLSFKLRWCFFLLTDLRERIHRVASKVRDVRDDTENKYNCLRGGTPQQGSHDTTQRKSPEQKPKTESQWPNRQKQLLSGVEVNQERWLTLEHFLDGVSISLTLP